MAGSDAQDAEELAVLLSLDGERFRLDDGHWVKFEAARVEPSPHVPHGVKYSLTLHDRYNQRILGYDNVHAVTGRKRRYQARRQVWDHRHEGSWVEPYDFDSPAKLLEDFWADVERVTGSGSG